MCLVLWLSPHWPFSALVRAQDCGRCCRPRCHCYWLRCWHWHHWHVAVSSSHHVPGSGVCSAALPRNSSPPRHARPAERWYKLDETGFPRAGNDFHVCSWCNFPVYWGQISPKGLYFLWSKHMCLMVAGLCNQLLTVESWKELVRMDGELGM